MTATVFSQTGAPCDCSSNSDNKIEKKIENLIALASKGDTKAQGFLHYRYRTQNQN